MDNIFLTKLLLSFIIGGTWAILATIIADKLGSKIGGLVTALPSTLMFGLFFIALTQNAHTAVAATTVIPITFGISTLFLSSVCYFLKRGVWFSLLISIVIWTALSSLLILFRFNDFSISLLGYLLLLLFSFWFCEKALKIKSLNGKKIAYSPSIIITRGLLSGGMVAASVLLAKLGGPIFGGVATSFPALFSSMLIITYFAHGELFSKAVAKSSVLGTISLVAYAVTVRFTYVQYGVVVGTVIAIVVSSVAGYLTYQLLIKKSA